MNMRIVRIPMIDGDPVEFGAEIALGIRYQLTRKGAQVRHVSRILRRNDEAEVVAILLTALGKGTLVDNVRSGVEQPSVRTIAGDAISFEISDVLGERGRTKPISAMPDHTRLDHHTARWRTER